MFYLERDHNTIYWRRWRICPALDGWQSDIAVEKDFYFWNFAWGVSVNNCVQLNRFYRPDFNFYLDITLFKWRFMFRSRHLPQTFSKLQSEIKQKFQALQRRIECDVYEIVDFQTGRCAINSNYSKEIDRYQIGKILRSLNTGALLYSNAIKYAIACSRSLNPIVEVDARRVLDESQKHR